MRVQRYPAGTRVRIRQGSLPMDPSTVGRTGLIVQHERNTRDRYAVEIDGESTLRVFAEDEIEVEGDGAHEDGSPVPAGGSESPS